MQVNLNGKDYTWDGKVWKDKDKVPVCGPTLTQLIKVRENCDWTKVPSPELLHFAKIMRNVHEKKQALAYLDIVINRNDHLSRVALSTYCSVLRKGGNSAEAIKKTDEYIIKVGFSDAFLATSRAAAYADLGMADHAIREIDLAINYNGSVSDHMMAVVLKLYRKGYDVSKYMKE